MLVVMLTVVRGVSEERLSAVPPTHLHRPDVGLSGSKPKLRLCTARSTRSVPASATGPSAALHCGALHHTLLPQAASLTRDTGLFLIEPSPMEQRSDTSGRPLLYRERQAPPLPAFEGRVRPIWIVGSVVLWQVRRGPGEVLWLVIFVTPACIWSDLESTDLNKLI